MHQALRQPIVPRTFPLPFIGNRFGSDRLEEIINYLNGSSIVEINPNNSKSSLIIVGGDEKAKQALENKSLSGRGSLEFCKIMNMHHTGIIMNNNFTLHKRNKHAFYKVLCDIPNRVDVYDEIVNKLELAVDGVYDLEEISMGLTTRLLFKIAFGVDSDKIEKDIELTKKYMLAWHFIGTNPNCLSTLGRLMHKTEMSTHLESIKNMNSRVKEILEDSNDESSFLKKLKASSDLNEANLLQCALEIILAGVDTSAHTIAFVLFYIVSNESVYKDLLRSLPDELDMSNMDAQLSELNRVIESVMRMIPVVPVIGRRALEDTVFDGRSIKKGQSFLILASAKGADTQYMFGLGRKKCPGKDLVMVEIKLFTFLLLKRFCFELADRNVGFDSLRTDWKIVVSSTKPMKVKVSCLNN